MNIPMTTIYKPVLLLRTSCCAITNNKNVCSALLSRTQSSPSRKYSIEKTIPVSTLEIPFSNTNNSFSIGTYLRASTSSHATNTTLLEEEVDKFRLLAGEWWKADGDFKLLHAMNNLRVALVRDGLIETGVSDAAWKDGPKPLNGLRILDVGCGGGILSEPLARLGATVTGLDAAEESIEVAKAHAAKDPKILDNLSYTCDRIEDHVLKLNEPYDAIVASEVLEHVASVDAFMDACCAGLKTNGSLFVTTINRTPQSYLGAIMAAEYLLKFVPVGTHDWNKFVRPQDLQKMLDQRGFRCQLVHGMFYLPFTNSWCWIRDTAVNYALHAVKCG